MKAEVFYRHERWLNLLLRCEIPRIHEWMLNRIYDRDFFAEMASAKAESARIFAEVVSANMEFRSVLDIGCGMGLIMAEFCKLGKDAIGCEASRHAIAMAPKELSVFFADATKPIPVRYKRDLVMCIEVAEHLNRRHSRQLVENCVRLGNQVLFTAAPPGQKGIGHINLRPQEFWQALFRQFGYGQDTSKTERIREELRERKVLEWLHRNLMVFLPARSES